MRGSRLHLPGNVYDLARQLEQICQEIPKESIRVPYHSMPRRVAACIQATVTVAALKLERPSELMKELQIEFVSLRQRIPRGIIQEALYSIMISSKKHAWRPSGIVASDADCCAPTSHKSSCGGREVRGLNPPEYSPSKLGWNRTKSYCHLYGAEGYG
ncbi:hypothetical protein TNCV_422711 [Trichonephila clavipes]|nr:hypothetical protein TNCV_422711 [Trichonephila clavipes]